LNPEPDLGFGSAILENLQFNFRFGSGRFRFEPQFRTELVHHYTGALTVAFMRKFKSSAQIPISAIKLATAYIY
jgi:hypothetical protein